METSAYQSTNIDTAFEIMIKEIFNKFHKQLEETPDDIIINDKGIDLNDAKNGGGKKKKCC